MFTLECSDINLFRTLARVSIHLGIAGSKPDGLKQSYEQLNAM
jgi:hypothetical protein